MSNKTKNTATPTITQYDMTYKVYVDNMVSRSEERNYVRYRFLLTLEAMRDRGHKMGYLGYVQWMNNPMTWYIGGIAQPTTITTTGGAITFDDIQRAADIASKSGGKL